MRIFAIQTKFNIPLIFWISNSIIVIYEFGVDNNANQWYAVFQVIACYSGREQEMSAMDFGNRIREYSQREDDIRLAETIHEYFRQVERQNHLPWKRLKSFFVAARSRESDTWRSLNNEQTEAIDNVLEWTDCSPNTIAVILRTYERSTSELRKAQREGRISRYAAESLSRLDKGSLKSLQPRVLEMYLKYGITNEELKKLVQRLGRTLTTEEQESILRSYIPEVPTREAPLLDTRESKSPETTNDSTIHVFREIYMKDLRKMSDEELWKLKGTTELAMSQAIPLLTTSLEHIKQELRHRLL